MDIRKIDKAVLEAERFILSAEVARRRLIDDFNIDAKRLGLTNINVYNTISKETASLKRASMDMTRALADMRNPNNR